MYSPQRTSREGSADRGYMDEPSRVKFSIQLDKKVNTSKDIAIDTEPHLLFDNVPDLYNDDGDLDEKYKYLLQLGKNRGAEEWIKSELPRYNEIDFFDRFPARAHDTSASKKATRIGSSANKDFNIIYKDLLAYGPLAESISLKNINYSFTPKLFKKHELMRTIVDMLEARSKLQMDMKIKSQGKGLLDQAYFNFGIFAVSYFKKIQPNQMSRDKLVFNFLWSLHHSKENELLELVIDILQDKHTVRDLLNLLMVKDIVKHHLRKTANLTCVDLAERGSSFQHSDTLVELARNIVMNYEDQFKVFYEEKFLQLKGDREYLTLFDFIGVAARAFIALSNEGMEGKLRKVKLYPTNRPTQYYHDGGNTIDNHTLRCFGKIPIDVTSGAIQDRAKVSGNSPMSPIKWHMWSDYPQNHTDRDRRSHTSRSGSKGRPAISTQPTSKEIGDFFSVELDDKMRRIKELSQKKKGKNVFSPVPYKNLNEKSKKIIDDLDINIKRKEDWENIVPTSDFNMETIKTTEFLSKFSSDNRDDMEVFGVFDRLPVKKEGGYDGQKPIMHQLRQLEQQEKRQADREEEQALAKMHDPVQIQRDRKMETIYNLLQEDLHEKCKL